MRGEDQKHISGGVTQAGQEGQRQVCRAGSTRGRAKTATSVSRASDATRGATSGQPQPAGHPLEQDPPLRLGDLS